ncbi:MAG: hypothetical protein RLZZ175_315 [Bacteroidota bacterium]|jgi:hypothetical protein
MDDKINNYKFKLALKQTVAERYSFFIKRIVAKEELWALADNEDNWSIVVDENGKNPVFHFWTDKEFASFCCVGKWAKMSPKKVDFHDFLVDWLPDMADDGVKIGVFTLNENENTAVSAKQLIHDLKEEEKRFWK